MTTDVPPLQAPGREPLLRRRWLLGLGTSIALHVAVLASMAAKAPLPSAPPRPVDPPGATLAWIEAPPAVGQPGPGGDSRTVASADALGVPAPQAPEGEGSGNAVRQPAASGREARPPGRSLAERIPTASAPPAGDPARSAPPRMDGSREQARAAAEPSGSGPRSDLSGPEEASRATATASDAAASPSADAREPHLEPEMTGAVAARPTDGSAAPAASSPADGERRSGAPGTPGSSVAPGHAGTRDGAGASGGRTGSGGPAGATQTVPQALVDQLRLAAQRCYPPVAQRFRLRGEVVVGFCAGRGGRAEALRIVESRGKASLDAAVDCVLGEAGALAVDHGCFVIPVAFGTAG